MKSNLMSVRAAFFPQSLEAKDNLSDLLAVQVTWQFLMTAGWSHDKSNIKRSSREEKKSLDQ